MIGSLVHRAIERIQEIGSLPAGICKICGGEATPFDVVDFNKSCAKHPYILGFAAIPVIYRMCTLCHFIFTEFGDSFSSEEWQTYVYNDAYNDVDPDYLGARPRHNAREIITLLAGSQKTIVGLDYGGGNGRTTALLRENGWAFDSYDPYGVTELSAERVGHYNFCSAIEVFEHTPNPVASLELMLTMANPGKLLILIGTSTHDDHVSQVSRLSWWYAAPRNGHVSLYSRRSLQVLAERFGLTYSSGKGGTSHLLARGYSQNAMTSLLSRGVLLRRMRSALNLWKGTLAED